MDGSPAAIMFWTIFSFLAVNQILFLQVECQTDVKNKSFFICPKSCVCSGNKVNCTNANLTRVPRDISPTTTWLILDGNLFRTLNCDSFSNLTRLRNLSLHNCKIYGICKQTFDPLSHSLRTLRLSNNQLSSKNCSFLKNLNLLEKLNLSETGRTSYHKVFKELPQLKELLLVKNSISTFRLDSISPTLEYLDLSENGLKNIAVGKGKNLTALKSLVLKKNDITELRDNSFNRFTSLKSIDLSSNKLTEVQPFAFRSKSLRIINLYNSKFQLDEDNWNVFQEAPNIQVIRMTGCRIVCGNLTRTAFHNLNHVTTLDVSATSISSFANRFTNMTKLKSLVLSKNPIPVLQREHFEDIADSLEELMVSSCTLSTVSFESLPLKIWKNLRKVDFSDNRFVCNCNFIWLRRWLKRANASNVEVKGWDNYYCQAANGPVNMFKLKSPSDKECFQDPLFEDPRFVAALLLTSLIWVFTSVASTLHRYRWHLRYWYFRKTINKKKRRDRYRETEELDTFTFDAFVGYSRSDANWVITQLLPRLENENNLRLCIHERDWLPGRDIAANILESIDNSRKTLLVVTNAFALSPWCHFELTMAQTRLMRNDRDSLILVLLEEIADCNLTPRLEIQMQRRSYVEWTSQSNVGQQLFWANLKHALAKPSDSLMNASVSVKLFD